MRSKKVYCPGCSRKIYAELEEEPAKYARARCPRGHRFLKVGDEAVEWFEELREVNS